MRTFVLYRDEDPSGVSGTGIVAEGVVFTDGSAVLRWRTEHKSTAVYATLAEIVAVHGHDGRTRIVWCGTPRDAA